MGGYQSAPSGYILTEIVAEFTVPPAPTNFYDNGLLGGFSIWPGLSASSSAQQFDYVLQPVLRYDYEYSDSDNPAGWWMRLESFCNGNCGGVPTGDMDWGPWVQVNVGDTILGVVYLDDNTPGSECNVLAGGSNCNYKIGWEDYTNPNLSGLSPDISVRLAPTIAEGLVFETSPQPAGYTACNNFPVGGGENAQVELFVFTWSGLYTPLSTNLAFGDQNTNSTDFQWQFLQNGQNAFTACSWNLGVGSFNSYVGEVTMAL
jgi:hypothetical protein